MQLLKRYKIAVIFFSLAIVVYFSLRFYHIMSLPIFTDEAIYMRWAQIAKSDASWRFISLTDGKQPLFIWITIAFMRIIKDPLLAGRVVSIFSGFGTLIGLYYLGKELFKNQWIGIIAATLYIFYPFGLVYDRMALYDDLVATFYIWTLYFAILLIRNTRLDFAFILGFIVGGGALNKSIELYSIYLLPVLVLLFDFKQKRKWFYLGKWILFVIIAVVISQVIYSILRLSPWFYIIKQKDATFFYSLGDLLHKPFTFWNQNVKDHLSGLFNWLFIYVTLPVLLLAISSVIFYKEYWKEKIILFLYFFTPFVVFSILAKIMYPRYLLFMTISLIPLAAYSLFKIFSLIKNYYINGVIFFLFISMWLWSDFYILTDFAHAPIPSSDLNQYSNDWPAGGGLKEIISYLQNESQNKKIYVGTEGTFGLMPYALELYLINNPNITIKSFWPIYDQPPQEVLLASTKEPTYFIFYQPCPSCKSSGIAPDMWRTTLLYRYTKINPQTYTSLYQINQNTR